MPSPMKPSILRSAMSEPWLTRLFRPHDLQRGSRVWVTDPRGGGARSGVVVAETCCGARRMLLVRLADGVALRLPADSRQLAARVGHGVAKN